MNKDDLFEQLLFVRNGGETRRFHGWPVLRQQTVAEHSFQVAMILQVLYGQEEPGISGMLLIAALTDDLAEWVTGDPPSPFTKAMEVKMPGFRAIRKGIENTVLSKAAMDFAQFLSKEEQRKIKFADYIDGAMYCIRERAMGNQLISPAFTTFMSYLPELTDGRDAEVDLMDELREAWLSANAGKPSAPTPRYYQEW